MNPSHFKLYKPTKNFPAGITPNMFKLAKFVLIEKYKDDTEAEVFFLSKSSKEKNTQEVSMEWITGLPPKAKPVTKAYFKSIVE